MPVHLDGHHRRKICQKHNLPFRTTEIQLPDELAAKEWIIRNQFGRRNLEPYQRIELAFQLEDAIRARAKEKQRQAAGAVRQKSAQAVVKTRDELAKAAGVSHDTIARARVIHELADEATKDKLRRGDSQARAGKTRCPTS